MDVAVTGCGELVEVLNPRVYGNGTQTLILSHGFGADQTVWHYILPYLAVYFKVIVFDMIFSPNVNPNLYDPNKYSNFSSYGQDLLCLLNHFNATKTIYLGHSMSAMVGCIAATHKPDLFEHLILLSGSPRYINSEGYHGGFERSDVERIFQGMEKNFSGWATNFAPKAIGVKNTTLVREFESSLIRMKPEVAMDVAKTVFLSDLRGVLGQVTVPCSIIQSEKDFVVPKSVAYYMKRRIGCYSRVEILKTEGHLPMLTAYPLLLNAIKRVLCL